MKKKFAEKMFALSCKNKDRHDAVIKLRQCAQMLTPIIEPDLYAKIRTLIEERAKQGHTYEICHVKNPLRQLKIMLKKPELQDALKRSRYKEIDEKMLEQLAEYAQSFIMRNLMVDLMNDGFLVCNADDGCMMIRW